MGVVKDRDVLRRKREEAAYQVAMDEFQSGKVRVGLMAKAVAESGGDESKAKASYIHLAAASILDDMYLADRASDPKGDAPVLVRGMCSLLIPGLGQMLQGRNGAAAFHLFAAAVLWVLMLGWIVHICSAIGAASYERRLHNPVLGEGQS